jgi:glycosyltransferase involved in cell wall biosynthesis
LDVMPRRALLVAPYFPPRRRVGSLRPFRFACYLEQFGWEPLVLCLATPGEALSAGEARHSEHVARIEMGTPFDRTRRHASGDFGVAARRVHPQPASDRSQRAGARWLSTLDAWVPLDTWAPLLAWHTRRLLPRLERLAPALIFSTADPWSSHLAGAWLARRLGVPWIADFRDPWTLCPYRGRGPRLTRSINRAFERHVFERASHATFTTERTLARYQAAYPDAASRMSCVPNGFDTALLADAVDAELEPLPAAAPVSLCFFGRFRALSPARAILLALGRLLERQPRARGKIRLVAVGELPPEDAALARQLGISDAFQSIAAVPYEQTLRLLRAHDVSLLSTAPERDDIVPAKLWDYLAARRPILSLGQNPDVAELLAARSAGLQLGPDATERIAELLESCVERKQRGEPLPIPSRPIASGVDDFDARRLTQRLAALFDAVSVPR